MKKLKNVLCIAIALLMIGTILAGCGVGGSAGTNEDTTKTRHPRISGSEILADECVESRPWQLRVSF